MFFKCLYFLYEWVIDEDLVQIELKRFGWKRYRKWDFSTKIKIYNGLIYDRRVWTRREYGRVSGRDSQV